MSKFGKYILPSVFVLVILAGIFIFAQTSNTVAAQDNSNTATIESRNVTVIIDGSGTISPERSLNLAFAVGGTVEALSVNVGDMVTSGTILATLDTTDLELQVTLAEQSLISQQANYNSLVEDPTALELAQMNTSLAQAQSGLASAILGQTSSNTQVIANCANLDTATDALATAQDAYEDYVQAGYEADADFMPDSDSQEGKALSNAQTNYDITSAQCSLSTLQAENETAIEAARAQLAQAEASRDALLAGATENQRNAAAAQLRSAELQLQQAQDRLLDAQILAPFDGLITEVNIIAGQTVGVNVIAVTIVDASELQIDVQIDELDIAKVEVGQPVNIMLDALEGTIVSGTVTRVSPSGIVMQGIVTYGVRVGLDETDEPIRLGMSADVEIEVAVLENVLVVPRRAIHRNDELGEYLVVQTSTGTQDIAVTPGYSVDGLIVVEGDIQAGQTVLLNEDN